MSYVRWFLMGEISKREFDTFIQQELGASSVKSKLIPMHNDFIICLLNCIRSDKLEFQSYKDAEKYAFLFSDRSKV